MRETQKKFSASRLPSHLLQQYSIHLRQVGDVTENQTTDTGSDADAHYRQLAVGVLERCRDELSYVNVRDEVSKN